MIEMEHWRTTVRVSYAGKASPAEADAPYSDADSLDGPILQVTAL